MKRKKVCIKTRLISGLTFNQGEDTKPATEKWSIVSTIEPFRTFVYDKEISAGGSSASVLRANQIARITSDFKMDILNTRK